MKNIFLAAALLQFIATCSFAQNTDILQATENEALINVFVANMEGAARPKDIIIFEGTTSGKAFQGISGEDGKFSILLPEGELYNIKIQGFGETTDFDQVDIPAQNGKIRANIVVKYEPERSFTLDDVHFDTGKSTLRTDSYAALNELADLLKIKDDIVIEIGGHTDNVGSEASNLQLSQARAETVVKYLVNKGVDAKRLAAKGYGQSQPIADNDTPEGRQANRRTEATILDVTF